MQTAQLVGEHVPRVLALLVTEYFRARKRSKKHMALAGEVEAVGAADYYALLGACRGGFVTLLRGIDIINPALNTALYEACRGGHAHIAGFLIKKGATDWECGLQGACRGGNRNLVLAMMRRGACNWDCALFAACRGGQIDTVQFLVQRGASQWNEGLAGACTGGSEPLALDMIAHGASDLGRALSAARKKGHVRLAQLMVKHGAMNWDLSSERHGATCTALQSCATYINEALSMASRDGHHDAIAFLQTRTNRK